MLQKFIWICTLRTKLQSLENVKFCRQILKNRLFSSILFVSRGDPRNAFEAELCVDVYIARQSYSEFGISLKQSQLGKARCVLGSGFLDFVHLPVFYITQRFGNWMCFRRVRRRETPTISGPCLRLTLPDAPSSVGVSHPHTWGWWTPKFLYF
jgi:hypothetical protein